MGWRYMCIYTYIEREKEKDSRDRKREKEIFKEFTSEISFCFKELAHAVVEISKSKICREPGQAGNSGRN